MVFEHTIWCLSGENPTSGGIYGLSTVTSCRIKAVIGGLNQRNRLCDKGLLVYPYYGTAVGQDVVDYLIGPALDPAGGWSAVRLQLRLDLTQTAPVQIVAEDPLYRLRALWHDLRLTVLTSAVSQQLAVLEGDLS